MKLHLRLERQVIRVARKKIIFVIVEGPSDEDALGVILSHIYDKNEVYLHVVRGDITTKFGISSGNIISYIGNKIREYAKDNHFKKTDFRQIIHIVDTDGAYIPDDNVIGDDALEKILYSTTSIQGKNKPAIELRNRQKRENINRLCTTPEIWETPYHVFYMSCNLDHVLYNKLNSSDEEKEVDAYHFAERYGNEIPAFWTFISSSDFSVMTGYRESWEHIKKELHSLERHSNLGLCFVEEFASENGITLPIF